MEAKFTYEKGSLNKWTAFMLTMLFVLGGIVSLTVLAVCIPNYADWADDIAMLSFAAFGIVWSLIAAVRLRTLDGIILYDRNCITVCRKRRKRIISFDDIKSVCCMPEVKHTRFAVKHNLVLTVLLGTGKELAFCQQLDIEKSFPVQQPEKFKEYIDEQPLMRLCNYINERARSYRE